MFSAKPHFSLHSASTDESSLLCNECLELPSRPVIEPPSLPAPPQVLSRVTSVHPFKRCILLQWVMEVAASFCLKRQSYYLAVDLIDRYLEAYQVGNDKLQLVGAAALYISLKCEDTEVVSLYDMCRTTDFAFTQEQLVVMELDILFKLDWKVYSTTPYSYLSWLMWEWDLFLMEKFNCKSLKEPSLKREALGDITLQKKAVVYLQPNSTSTRRYHYSMLLLDSLNMHYYSKSFQVGELAVALLFMVTKRFFEETQYGLLSDCMASYFCNPQESLNEEIAQGALILYEMFSEFVYTTTPGVDLHTLISHMEFVHEFMLELPEVFCSAEEVDSLASHYKELATQTYSPLPASLTTYLIKKC